MQPLKRCLKALSLPLLDALPQFLKDTVPGFGHLLPVFFLQTLPQLLERVRQLYGKHLHLAGLAQIFSGFGFIRFHYKVIKTFFALLTRLFKVILDCSQRERLGRHHDVLPRLVPPVRFQTVLHLQRLDGICRTYHKAHLCNRQISAHQLLHMSGLALRFAANAGQIHHI